MYAALSLDHKILKDIVKKIKPAVRRELVDFAKTAYPVNLRRACRVVGVRDSVYRYPPNTARDDAALAGYSKRSKNIQRMALASYSRSSAAGAIDGITNGSTVSIVG